MPFKNRRTILASFVGLLSTLLSGCTSSADNPTERTSDQSGTSPQPKGAPVPWVDPNSEADIAIKNGAGEKITAQINAGNLSKEIVVESGGYWASGNIIDDGERLDMTISTNSGLSKTVRWNAEQDNDQVAIFTIEDSRITGDVYVKGNG